MSISNNLLSAFIHGVATYKEMKEVIDAAIADDDLLEVMDIIDDIDSSGDIDDLKNEFNDAPDSFDDYNDYQLKIK